MNRNQSPEESKAESRAEATGATGLPKDEAGLVSQAKRLSDLVNYQPGAVVSRQVIAKPTGTVTLFAFDKGEGLSEHTAPFDALVEVLEGEVEITISKQPLTLRQGDAVIMPAGEPHALKALTRFKMLLVMIKS
ncbi:MAG: cupin domain-containing protein [Candidatus Eisenbacteria bacterium]